MDPSATGRAVTSRASSWRRRDRLGQSHRNRVPRGFRRGRNRHDHHVSVASCVVSALRLGRLPDGTRHVLILEPAVGRTSFTRHGIHGGGEYVVAPSAKYSAKVEPRTGAHRSRAVCGKWMRQSKEPCARTPGHGTECRSAASLDRAAGRSRTDHHDPALPTAIDRQARRRAYQREWQRERRALGLR
jgi:hypothetical protein